MISDRHVQARAAALIKRVGKQMVYRAITRTTGPEPTENPPSASALSVVGTTALGASSITLDAAEVYGHLKPGDQFTIAGNATVYTITNTVAASSNTFTGVTFTPTLAAQAADNAVATMVFAADTTIYARVGNLDLRLVNGTGVKMGDLMIKVPKTVLSAEPQEADTVFMDGRPFNVIGINPAYAVEEPALWTIQLRGR